MGWPTNHWSLLILYCIFFLSKMSVCSVYLEDRFQVIPDIHQIDQKAQIYFALQEWWSTNDGFHCVTSIKTTSFFLIGQKSEVFLLQKEEQVRGGAQGYSSKLRQSFRELLCRRSYNAEIGFTQKHLITLNWKINVSLNSLYTNKDANLKNVSFSIPTDTRKMSKTLLLSFR